MPADSAESSESEWESALLGPPTPRPDAPSSSPGWESEADPEVPAVQVNMSPHIFDAALMLDSDACGWAACFMQHGEVTQHNVRMANAQVQAARTIFISFAADLDPDCICTIVTRSSVG